ncbi:GNAT family N-acetyltransferase [Paenibacillus alvei]|uniref:GNAT family N-acetyltransferase n=1 Tax=Paenibacillus alvei TaxID=44250 RepID=A0ABT4H5T5_PAEAL|nr:GNAT family N-acetyltransferase [Paenibacillus alvei]MCY7487732.1 GNAT family N-acetyltransferase [Paenibacillus alvei]MCY9764336.1 GNAT family N-acetyltransferase [Paenibacillus alvei]MCY9766946.1 GNAT family N-acetyltransferase [Paenibacillus alvei]
MVAKNEEGGYAAYCGLWYCPVTDYAYVEPLCVIPAYWGRGLGRAVLVEALKRSHALGAKAYVISDLPIYKTIGFEQHSNYSFYWRHH